MVAKYLSRTTNYCQLLALGVLLGGLPGSKGAFIDTQVKSTDWQGWGSSLAWFGDVLGGLPQDVQDEIVSGLFSTDRLNLNILRYTIGGTTPGDSTCGEFRAGGATESFKDGPDSPYIWTRDPRARKVLLAAMELAVDTVEAFSNSPPQWMTKSGCSKGNPGGAPLHDNFDPANADIFTDYLTEVVKYYHNNWGVTFTSIAPFNEPSSGYWPGPSGSQEGCCMERSTMVTVIRSLHAALESKGMLNYTSISVADETEINQELLTQRTFTGEGVASLYTKVNTHGYSDNGHENRAELYTLSQRNGHVLWMDEVGWGASPVNDMTQGINVAERIVYDLRNMNPAAWVYWQAMEDQKNGAWGLVDVPYEDASLSKVRYTSGYYAMMQFSKYIKKGFQIVYVSDSNSVAAYDPSTQTLVIVVVNSGSSDSELNFDLTHLSSPPKVTATRTSSTEQNADIGEVPLTGEPALLYSSPPKSVTTFVLTEVVPQTLPNLIVNGDFESERKEGWGLLYGSRDDGGINGQYVYTGAGSGYIDFSVSELSLMQNVTAPASKKYYLSARVATSGSRTSFGVLINGQQGPDVTIIANAGYQPYGIQFSASQGDIISIYLYGPSGNNNGQIDNVMMH